MTNLAGTPGVKDSVTALGSIPANVVKGIICVQGITKRGEAGKNYLVSSWADFRRALGGLHEEDDFSLQCKHALENGAKLRVSRAAHFNDIDDASTIEGDTSNGNLANAAVEAVAATAVFTIATWTGTGSNLTVTTQDMSDPSSSVTLCNYNGTASQTPSQAATAARAAINGGTGTHSFTAGGTGAEIIVTHLPDYGDLGNLFSLTTNITLGTLTGANPSFSGGVFVGGAFVKATLATWTGSGSNFKLVVKDLNNPGSFITICDYNGTASQTIPQALQAIKAEINGGTGTHGYDSQVLPGNILVVAKPDALGAAGNGDVANLTITLGTVSGAALKFAGGVTAYGALTSTWYAKGVGAGYDGATIEITPSTNGKADQVDIKVTLPDSDLPQEVKGIARVLTAPKIVSLNKQLEGVSVTNLVAFTLPVGTATLAAGSQDVSLINDVDFNGSSVSKTGWHSFDEVVDSMRIWNIARPTHAANNGLAAYCEARRDVRGRGYAPAGLTIQGLNDFRQGNGVYLHTPTDSFYFDLWFAELFITDPQNLEVPDYVVNGGGFQAGNRAKADNAKGEWYSDSGNDFGKIRGANGLRLNLGSPGNAGQYDSIYESGLNAVINDQVFKVVSWGNRTTLLDRTSLLSKANIADLVVFIARETKAIARLMNFKPNDIAMFNELYRRVLPFIKDTLVAGRAIEGDASPTKGEGKWWHWLGDQYAKDLNDLKVNQKSEVDAGKYRARFAFKPIASNEYIALDIAPADSTTILNVQILTSLNG